MGDELAERVEALERKAERLRRWVLVLGAALVGCVAVGVSQPQELTLRKLTIVDDDGKERITAGTRNRNPTSPSTPAPASPNQRLRVMGAF